MYSLKPRVYEAQSVTDLENSISARFRLNDSDLHFIYEIENLRKLNLIGSVQIGNVTSYRESWRFMKLPYIMHYIKING